MHPAPSVILFTTLSGLGFGLLFWLGLGLPALTGWSAFWGYGVGFALAVGGLSASTFHLGRPERAIKAFSQWRTSWLSREAWCAVIALVLLGLHALGPAFMGVRFGVLGLLGALMAIATVVATGMIYAQIRAVPRWHQPGTPVHFVAFSLAGGALLAGQGMPAAVLLAIALAAQVWVWRQGDGAFDRAGSTVSTATGLTAQGTARAFEAPHTAPNYLLREMVFQVGRVRASALRRVTVSAGILLPLILLGLGGGALLATWIAAVFHAMGVLASRWLFFAEAEHVVGLYYGAPGGRTQNPAPAVHG